MSSRSADIGADTRAITDLLRDLRPPRTTGFEVRFETPPGEQAQVDFAQFVVEFTDEPGVKRIVWLFSMVLGYSRLIWARFVLHQDLQTVLRCHIAALEAIGGVPREILYDRMKTAVIGEDLDGLVIYNRALLDLARHYGFQPRACRPYRAKTKGKVERPFRYIREDFFLAGSFRNLEDLNGQLRHWLDTVANPRVHATTRRVVNEAFAEERSALKPLPLARLSSGPQARTARVARGHGLRRRQPVQRAGHDAPPRSGRPCPGRRDPHLRRRRAHRLSCAARRAWRKAPRSRASENPRSAAPTGRQRQVRRSSRAPAIASLAVPSTSTKRSGAVWLREARYEHVHRQPRPAVIDRVKRNLVGLKMPRALEILDVTLRGIERGEMTALEAIDILLAEELTLRENRRVKMALQMARLSAIKTLAGFDFSFQPSLDKNRIMALAELQFIDRAEAVHLIGPPGTGKTHLSLALGVEAVKAGRSVYFGSLADIVATLAKAEREGALRERIRYFCRFSLLIVDEIGYLPVIPGGGNLFFQLVNARYEKGAMILTSNRGFAEWGEIFGDPVVATALLDRLLHHAVVFQIEGSSYRLREHADLVPEHIRIKANIQPAPIPPTLRRRGRPPKNGGADLAQRLITIPAKLGNFTSALLGKIRSALTIVANAFR